MIGKSVLERGMRVESMLAFRFGTAATLLVLVLVALRRPLLAAPGERGTMVSVVLDYSPPAGKVGQWIAKLFGEEPEQQVREDLRNFKRTMEAGEIPTTDHDVALDLIITPERVIEIPRRKRRSPAGIRWGELTEEKIAAIPLLARLRRTGR